MTDEQLQEIKARRFGIDADIDRLLWTDKYVAFIAAARDAVPELIAEVDRLRTELAQAQAQAENERARRKHDSTDAYNARINAAVRQMEYYCK